MATTALPPLSTSSTSNIQDRYLFRSLSNDNQRSTARKSKYNSNRNPIASTTPPSMRKRYKFSSTPQDQNTNNTDVYKFSTSPTEQRSQSTGSDRYYFRPDDSTRKPEQRLTYVRSGDGLEQRNVTFIDGASTTPDKHSSQTIIPDTPYLFSKPTESQRYPSATSSVNPEDLWLDQRKQPHIIFDSITDSSPTSQLKRARTTSLSPDRTQIKHSPARMDTVTSTNGSLSTIQRSPANKTQNVRFDPSSTQRSYLSEARERLAGKQRGRSPQAFQQSVDRLASSTTQKYLQQQILSPPIPFQAPQQHHYVSQYYAHEEGEPPIDYPMDSDDDEPSKRSATTTTTTTTYNRGSLANRTHTLIMKNVNKSLIDRNYLAGTDRIRQLEQNAHRYLRFMENQALQRELNHDLIRCFSSTYLDDLRREEIRHNQARLNMRPYTYEDIQDIHMSSVLESYKMKKAIDRERRVRLNASFDGQITASTPTSSILAGHLSPLLSNYSPIMTGSLNENIDVHSGGFEIDRRSQKSQISSSQTPTGIRPGHGTPGPAFDLFYDIMQDRFRGVDASIAGQVSTASQYKKRTDQPTTTTTSKAIDHDSDIDPGSYASLWSDDDDEQMIVDNQRQSTPQQKQLSRYWSTVNRSLLDRPSDLIADFYISKLNQGMQESVRHVENIARDKALMRQNRNREFVDEPTNKLGRSLSAEHLYQVRKEHLRYKQPFNTPTSFTVEDVEDIYKPFVLENYKRKIAIELERRRRERQGQLMAGMTSPPSYVSDIDSFNALKATQPPIIESPLRFRQSQLDRTRIVHTNDYGPQRSDIIVPRPVVQTREIPVGRARRTLTDDGSADVIHHVGIISPPLSYSIVAPTPKRTTISTSTRNQNETPQVTTISPPDFVDRNQTLIRQQRIHPHIAQPTSNELVDSPLTTTQQVLIKDSDHDPNLRRPVQIITSIETDMVTSRRPQARIYTSSPQAETVRVCHADRVETDSGNYDLSMVNIRPIVTLNQGEIRELSFIAQEAQRLQIPTHDYDHAMIMLSPDQIQDQHNIHRQPLLLAAANIDLIYEEPNEQVTRHVDPHVQHERTNLIMPIAEHMAKVEQDIPVFENLSSANIILPARNKLQEVPHDSGIVSLNTSQASEQPMIFNASRINRLETSDDQHLENLHEDDYYRRRIRALDLLRSVDTDPNANIQPVHSQPMEIFENTTDIPTPKVQREHTTLVDDHRMDQMQTLEHTDKPIVYESTESNRIEQMPGSERLTSSDIRQDIQTTNRAEENQIQWGQIRTQPERRSTENRLSNVDYEQVKPMSPTSSYEQRDNLRLTQEPLHAFETPKRPTQNVVYNYGEENEAAMHRASSIESDKDLQNATKNLARVEYDRRSLSSLDDITQPISYHPPVQTNRDQQHQAMELDVEPMAVREETALENEVSYDGSFGRASFTQPIQPLNAPRTLAQTDLQTMLLEDLTTATSTAVHAQHATSSTDTEQPHNIFERIEENNRIPIVVYDTDWTDEKVQPISNEFRTNFQNAQQKYSKTIEYQKAKIVSPKSILSREHYEEIDNNNQELAQQIDTQPIPTDHLIERMEIDTNLSSNSNQLNTNSPQAILCQPIDQQIQMNDEDAPSISDDSLHVRDQQRSNVNTTQNLPLENPLRSTAFLTFNYAQHSEQLGPTWQRSSDQQIGSPIHSQEQHLQIEREQISPRYLPSIASVDNYVSEFQQTPLLHENVRIENTERIPLLPPTHVNQIQPIYRVRQQQISVDDDYDPSAITSIRPDRTDQVNISSVDTTRIESVPVTVNIDVRVRPTQSETSSLADQEGVLDPFEQNIESEQHLPLVDQISLTYSASIRSIQDETQRAIERYEQEHPYFSRSLPREWIEPPVLPHDEQLVEQWIVERNLDIIQQQEYLEHATTEIINPSADSSPVYPLHSPFNRTDKARQSTESYNLERLPVQHYLELNLNTPTASMRRVRPDRPGSYTEDIIMDSSTHTRIESPIRSRQDDLKYASTTTRDHSEQLPPQHLPVDYVLDRERARIVPETNVSFSELNKNDEVLIRDTIVQHISEDEKSTSSEEVIFEEWSEEFRCRRTDEYDKNTNRLIRTTIDETSGRVKSDVIKEEYKEKNERIKGHKSYDVVKEVYRRVPAHSVDPKTSTIVSIEPATSHVYEEIPQVPHSTTSSLFERQVPVEHTPRNRQWSFEDNYTTEIVYDSKLARDIESSARAQRTDTRFDSSTTPPSSTTTITAANYDRVRPGQYPSMPSASQATISTVPSSNYDRISNIVTPSTHFADRRQTERDEIVSEEYHVEFEQQQHSDRRSPSIHRQELTIPTKQQQQRDETSEEDVSDPYVVTGDDRTYHGLTTIVNEAGQRRDSDWRNKLKQIYAPSSDEERFDQSSRSRDVTKRVITTTTVDDDRPQPPKRSSSSSSFIDERRSRFEQQQQQAGSTSPFSTNVIDRPSAGRVGELRNAFETTITTTNLPDDSTKYKSSVSSNLNERRRIFEEQEQLQRRSSDEFQANERRMSETHTAPSRVQSSDRLGRTGFDTIKSTLESSMVKSTEHETPVDTRIKDKRTISSIDSDLSGSPPPIYQSTPKSTQQKRDDLGDESEDELSDPTTTKQDQSLDSRRRSSKPRSRDFSQSTPQTYDASYLSHRSKSTFNETNMENILSHVPTSKGKGLLIELSPHISHETPITTTTKPIRDPHKPAISSDSGIFDYSTATSHHVPASSTSWRNNASSSVLDDVNYTPTNRDSGVYIDSAATASSRYGRRLASDTDQTTIHGGDDSVSRSTFKYDTEIISNDQLNQPTQTRNIRRQITNSPPSDYENIANYHSGISSLRQVPITTQSRSNSVKPLVVDEIETIETETHVECQVQRTHEIKESTTTERASSPGGPKRVVTTTTTTTTTKALPPVRSPESSSDETPRLTTSAKRVLLNERPQYYETGRSIRAPPESTYTPTSEIRQQTQTYRLDSPPSDSLSYPLPPPPQIPHTSTVTTRENDLIRVEETGFKPIQSPAYRSTNRALSAGPRSVEVTSLSPPSQVTFGTYSPSEVIAIVRVPDLTKTPGARQSPSQTIKHGASEPEIYARAKQEDEQRSKLHYQRVHAASYRPPPPVPVNSDYQQRQARSRIGAYETPNEYSSPLGVQTRSSSYHSALHEQDRQQQQQQQQQTSESYPYSPSTNSTYRRQVQRRSGSLGNLLGSNIEFEIEIEKRPPQQPEQPTVVALDQPTRAIVTTSRDGRVSIQNIAARPGNTVVINSDFHSSDRSLNRSSGYFSSDELRSQGITTNYSSDEQSSAAAMNQPNGQFSSAHARRFRNNDPTISRLPAHYRPKSNTYQPLNNENFDRVNQMVHRYHRQSNGSTGFNDTIDQIDALYNNLNIQSNEDYRSPQTNNNNNNNNSPSTYDFSKTPSTLNRRKNLSPNSTEYAKRYSSTGFQHMQSQYDSPTSPTADNSTLLHLVSPPIVPTNDRRRYDAHRAFSDNENLNPNQHNRNWAASSSLTDLVSTTPIRPSQSLSSSGILADYGTPGSISPNSGFGSTQNVVLQQNRLNSQQQIVQRNRTSVKQMKQKSAAKKKSGNHQGQYSDEEDENDSAGGHDSPLSDGGRPQVPSRYSNRHQ